MSGIQWWPWSGSCFAASDLDLHRLFRPVCLNTKNNFPWSQDVRAFKVSLYNVVICHMKQMSVTACLVPIENWCVYVSVFVCVISLRKYAYLDILKILPPKNKIFQIKNSNILHISAQNIACGYSLEPPRRGGSNEYPQSIFKAEIRKIMYTPVNASFTV